MPSGVIHGRTGAGAAAAAAASIKAICVKSGTRLIYSPELNIKNIVSAFECRQGVAAVMNERLDAGGLQRSSAIAGPPGKVEVAHASGREGLRCRCPLILIDFV